MIEYDKILKVIGMLLESSEFLLMLNVLILLMILMLLLYILYRIIRVSKLLINLNDNERIISDKGSNKGSDKVGVDGGDVVNGVYVDSITLGSIDISSINELGSELELGEELEEEEIDVLLLEDIINEGELNLSEEELDKLEELFIEDESEVIEGKKIECN